MMSAGIEIKVIDPNDSSIYSRSANSRLISSESQINSLPTTSKAVQIASGKRKSFEAKNDAQTKQSSDRRVNSHMPKFTEDELKNSGLVFEAVKIVDEEKPIVVDLRGVPEEELTPLSPKILSEYGRNLVQLNISPPLPRKVEEAVIPVETEKPKVSERRKVQSKQQSNRRQEISESPKVIETTVVHEVGTEEVAPKSSRRREVAPAVNAEKPKRSSKRRETAAKVETPNKSQESNTAVKVEEIMETKLTEAKLPEEILTKMEKVELSPVAQRRPEKAKSSPRKSSKRNKTKSASPTSGNLHFDDRSVISPQPIVDTQGTDRHSNRRKKVPPPEIKHSSKKKSSVKKEVSARPKSPHRVTHDQPTIRIGGREVTSRDYGTSDTSTSQQDSSVRNDLVSGYNGEATPDPTTPSDTSNTDTTARRKIKSRQDGLEKALKEKLGNDEFCPDDDEHLDLAIKIALEESQKQSVQEALEAGHDLNAEVLKSLHRPNAISEVIEKLVSQRREKIHEKKVSQRKSQQRSKKENQLKQKKASVTAKSGVKTKDIFATNKPNQKLISGGKSSLIEDDAEEDEQPEIDTVEEIYTQPKVFVPPPIPTPPKKKKTTSKRRVVKPEPVIIEEIPQVENKGRSIKKEEPNAAKGKEEVDEANQNNNNEEESEEENVKLPKAERAAKPTDDLRVQDVLTGKDILRQRDLVYDPHGMPDEPDDNDDESIGDNVYEESSEDDDVKLTINEKKDEMFYRFKLIKEAYPGISLPRITRKMKLAKMVRHYEHVMSRIKLKVKTNNFKVFLIIGFLAMQFAGKKLGLNTEGFTVNQMTSMKRYERMLREFGESDWSSIGVDLPVTIRLPFFMLVNMGIFVIAKWIFQKTKKDYSVQFHKLYAQLTGGDDYVFIKDETGDAGMAAGDGGDDGGGGIFGMLKPILSMFGGMGGGGGNEEEKPKRGEAAGPSYVRRKKKD